MAATSGFTFVGFLGEKLPGLAPEAFSGLMSIRRKKKTYTKPKKIKHKRKKVGSGLEGVAS